MARKNKIPPCAASMGCLCAFHANGGATWAPCDTSEPLAAVTTKPRFQGDELYTLNRLRESRVELDAQIAALVAKLAPEPLVCCGTCGGGNVEHASWINPNTREIGEDFGSWNAGDNTFCHDCETNAPLVCSDSEAKRFAALRKKWHRANRRK